MIIDSINVPVIESWRKAMDMKSIGFTLIEFDSVNSRYCRTLPVNKNIFSIGFEAHPYVDDVVRYCGFLAAIELSAVDIILRPLIIKYIDSQLDNSRPGATLTYEPNMPGHSSIWKNLHPYYEDNFYKNETLVTIFAEEVSRQVGLYLEPFWSQYADIQYINDEIINKIPHIELHQYLGGMTPEKKLIIMKLCSNPNFDVYKNWLLKVTEIVFSENPDFWANSRALRLELSDILDKV
ncbi:hypothetical protein [Fibrella aquatilis]|uniref:Uncharacterized protein n=1 Tax=Fibrella aquatilis TaxID=2817059 RepID=A0A939G288_9BACT|nr:hypothetical protein [Fibrella aquatilis]MBO0929833.1 hypothetical protein [Fibrella aquatilis]